MSKIHQIRQQMRHKLDQWEAVAESMELQLTLGRAELLQRYDREREHMSVLVKQLKTQLVSMEKLAAGTREKLTAAVAHLEVQLALGRAETQDAYFEQRDKLRSAIRALEDRFDEAANELGGRFEQQLEAGLAAYVSRADRLMTELESLEYQFQVNVDSAKQHLLDNKNELLLKIQAFRKHLAQRQTEAKEKFHQVESELAESVQHLKAAFMRSFKKN